MPHQIKLITDMTWSKTLMDCIPESIKLAEQTDSLPACIKQTLQEIAVKLELTAAGLWLNADQHHQTSELLPMDPQLTSLYNQTLQDRQILTTEHQKQKIRIIPFIKGNHYYGNWILYGESEFNDFEIYAFLSLVSHPIVLRLLLQERGLSAIA